MTTLFSIQMLAPKDGRKNRQLSRYAVVAESEDAAVAIVREHEGIHVEGYTVHDVFADPTRVIHCHTRSVPSNFDK